MHVTIVAACEKRALSRTRRTLDSYAKRIGPRTWVAPITLAGLSALRKEVAINATRQTAVACFKNDGLKGQKLVWVVGSRRRFSTSGDYPLGHKNTATIEVCGAQSSLILMSKLAGLTHDLGKALCLFQEKLRNETFPQSDPVRHEWLSMEVVTSLIEQKSLAESLACLRPPTMGAGIPFDSRQGLSCWASVLKYAVGTHHGLYATSGTKPSNDHHVRVVMDHPYHDAEQTYLQPHAKLDESLVRAIEKSIDRMREKSTRNTDMPWPAIATYARACLIMADHVVSSRQMLHKSSALYANTTITDGTGKRRLNQDLNYHLEEVGSQSAFYAYHWLNQSWYGLHAETQERILMPSLLKSYRWQNTATAALVEIRASSVMPSLVFNVGGTGSGKTRMNIKAVVALNRRSEPRASVAMNLRSLTLQTADAYKKEFRLTDDELVAVIGDSVVKKLHHARDTVQKSHAAGQGSTANDDDNQGEVVFEGSFHEPIVPRWLDEYVALRPTEKSILCAPVLVSTIDYLIAAGEPSRQGHHVSALLRLRSSDLVLDEVDDYDEGALVAVCRLILAASTQGCNVIISTATLPQPAARYIMQVFAEGVRQYSLMEGKSDCDAQYAIIDDVISPKVGAISGLQDYGSPYENFIKNSLRSLKPQHTKVPFLKRFDGTPKGFFAAIKSSILELHKTNKWVYGQTNKELSIGLVRVANIKTAIKCAKYLSNEMPDAYIATYHSQDFKISRYKKEVILDDILNRKAGNVALENSAYVQCLVDRCKIRDVKLIVVATPVEEVGRDHDFDWAVIEPSSARSTVQTAGRVNRHRRVVVSSPNIHILQFNFRCCENKQPAFTRPGYESVDNPWDTHDLAALLNWDLLVEITSGLRLGGGHTLSMLEDAAIERALNNPIQVLLQKKKPLHVMTEGFYLKYPLRSKQRRSHWVLRDDKFHIYEKAMLGRALVMRDASVCREGRVANAWLSWDVNTLSDLAANCGIKEEDAFEVRVPNNRVKKCESAIDTPFLTWHSDFGFTVF